MAFSTELLGLMPSTIKVSTRIGHDNYGAPSWDATSTSSYRARILEKPGYVRASGGEEVAYRHVIWARSTSTGSITASDRITLPDGSTPPIISVERYYDEDGPNHVKIFMGW